MSPESKKGDKVSPAISAFGCTLLAALHGAEPERNVLISPTSIELALAMTLNGARGATRAAMLKTLCLGRMPQDEMNEAFAALLDTAGSPDPRVRLALANSLWGSDQESFRADFVRRCEAYYDAEVRNVDFTQPVVAAGHINGWVEAETEGMITTLVEPDNVENAILVLVNAIYFKGQWAHPFDPAQTAEGPFRLLDGSDKLVPMMQRSGGMLAYADDDVRMVALPYGSGSASMWVVLPAEGTDFASFLEALTPEVLAVWHGRATERQGRLELPRFKVEGAAQLSEPLSGMGMRIAFGPEADFSGMASTPPPIAISEVLHKAVMEVNEEGAEAAAATAVVMTRSMPVSLFRMRVDRPFLCLIRDDRSGAFLFMGAIVDPQ